MYEQFIFSVRLQCNQQSFFNIKISEDNLTSKLLLTDTNDTVQVIIFLGIL